MNGTIRLHIMIVLVCWISQIMGHSPLPRRQELNIEFPSGMVEYWFMGRW